MNHLFKNIYCHRKLPAILCSKRTIPFLNNITILQSALSVTITLFLLFFATHAMAAQQNNSKSTILSNAETGNGGSMFNSSKVTDTNWGTTSISSGRGIGLPCKKSADNGHADYLDPYACFDDTTTFGQGLDEGASDDLIYQCQGNSKSAGFTSLGTGFSTYNFDDKDCSDGSDNNLDPFNTVSTLSMTQIASALASTQTSLNPPTATSVTGLDPASAPDPAISQTWNSGTARINLSPMFEQIESSLAEDNDDTSDCYDMSAWSDAARKRCNTIDEAFSYKLEEDIGGSGFNRLFHASFSINSITDENGDLVGEIEGEYNIHYQEADGAGIQDDQCKGSFTVKEVAGVWYYNNQEIKKYEASNPGFWITSGSDKGAVDPCKTGGGTGEW